METTISDVKKSKGLANTGNSLPISIPLSLYDPKINATQIPNTHNQILPTINLQHLNPQFVALLDDQATDSESE